MVQTGPALSDSPRCRTSSRRIQEGGRQIPNHSSRDVLPGRRDRVLCKCLSIYHAPWIREEFDQLVGRVVVLSGKLVHWTGGWMEHFAGNVILAVIAHVGGFHPS
jgi:hypothetical protein